MLKLLLFIILAVVILYILKYNVAGLETVLGILPDLPESAARWMTFRGA